jgi:nitrile hydratase beta subunit
MNGAHDLGGMHGFGRIDAEPETKEPVFHADWEKRVFGLVRAVGALGKWNSDMSRYARERQHPVDYLSHSYYENWLAGLEKLLVETGLVTAEELASGARKVRSEEGGVRREEKGRSLSSSLPPPHSSLSVAEEVAASLARGSSAAMPADSPPRFRPGDRVRARNRHPIGHTREPRYVRGHIGVIQEHHGAHVFPDLSAEGVRVGRHLYTVRFEASELWGENANGNSAVYVDLWEDYLEPA